MVGEVLASSNSDSESEEITVPKMEVIRGVGLQFSAALLFFV